jgi:hypothetical protein
MMNGHAKTKTNGQTGPAKAAIVVLHMPEPAKPPADPMAFVDELPAKIRSLVEAVRAESQLGNDKKYAEGMRRAMRLVAIAVGQLDGASKQRIVDVLDQLESEAAKAEKTLRAP